MVMSDVDGAYTLTGERRHRVVQTAGCILLQYLY